ncbi:hypothetical protein GCM10020220_090900 [Nonomuraea rubra]|uniref:hypothetical protein n=1 Tax=Nonomuraea rubra TaxID=46180 RepID=UPI0031E5F55A
MARVSGPCTAALTCPPCSQKTRSQLADAMDVMRATSSLRLRHTRSTYGESDGRLSTSKPIGLPRWSRGSLLYAHRIAQLTGRAAGP